MALRCQKIFTICYSGSDEAGIEFSGIDHHHPGRPDIALDAPTVRAVDGDYLGATPRCIDQFALDLRKLQRRAATDQRHDFGVHLKGYDLLQAAANILPY